MPLTPEQAAALGLPAAPQRRVLTGDEAAALGLPGQAPPARDVPASEVMARGFSQGLSSGFLDEGAGAIAAALPFLDREAVAPGLSDVISGNAGDTFGDRYRRARDFYRAKNKAAQEDSPKLYGTSLFGGGVVQSMSPAGKALKGVKGAAAQGAAAGLGFSEAEDALGALGDTAGGGLLGVGGYGLAKGVGSLGARLVRALRGAPQAAVEPLAVTGQQAAPGPRPLRSLLERTDPTPEAKLLRERGINLTIGQTNPRSVAGQIEEASTSLRGAGPLIKGQRDAAVSQWQNLLMNEARAPGAAAIASKLKPEQQLDEAYKGFRPVYDAIRGEEIFPAIHNAGKGTPLQTLGKSLGAFDKVVKDPNVIATNQERAMVEKYLTNQLTILPKRQGAVGRVDVGDVLAMRSNIRDAIRSATGQNQNAVAQLLGNAEEALTASIESQVSPKVAQALKAADAQYWRYKILEDAVAASRSSPSGFTPSQVEAALARAMSRGEYARGGGGPTRELANAGKVVFESVTPPTGARLLTVGPMGEMAVGPMAWAANRPPPPALPPAQAQAIESLRRALSAIAGGGVVSLEGDQ